MKIGLISDQHIGVRNDNQAFMDYFEKFYDTIFFPNLKKNNIKIVIDLGDLFDRRKFINFLSLQRAREMYFDRLEREGIKLYSIVGNHNTFYRNTNEVNSLRLLASHYSNIEIIEHDPRVITLDGTRIMLMPWIADSNREICNNALKKENARVLMGHLEIQGFQMYQGHVCSHGYHRRQFDRFELVLSGHFHHKSMYQNIHYLGAPYEMMWNDYNDPRGFHLFDTDTLDLTFIQNPYRMFHKIFYEDDSLTIEELDRLDFSKMNGTYIKVIVKDKNNPYIFDMFMDKVQASGALDIKVVEDHKNLYVGNTDIIDEAKSTQEILTEYVNNTKTNLDKETVKTELFDLYREALNAK